MIQKRSRSITGVLLSGGSAPDSPKIEELLQDGNWSLVRTVIEDAVNSYETNNFRSILHVALSAEAPEEVVKMIMSACPESVQERDHYGRLPIHMSCLLGASNDTVRRLLETDPTSAVRKDNDGRLALHYAVQYCVLSKGDTIDTVELLCAYAPTAANARDGRDQSPADMADEMLQKAKLDNDVETAFAASDVSLTIDGVASGW